MDNAEVAAVQKELDAYLHGTITNQGEVQGNLRLIHKGNHLIWKGEYRDGYFALRMADPTHYRGGEWLSARQEYALLDALRETRLVPQPHTVIISSHSPFIHPVFVMMEWIDGTPLNAFKETRK